MAELGEELRRERVRRNLTFKDVEQVLHIKTTYLEAIEDGNYDIIPGQVYVKGFIRNYGNYLDLDGDRLVKAYQSQVGDIEAEQTPVDYQCLKQIHDQKTGALFRFALEAGAIIGGADASTCQALRQFGRHFGLAYQIHNDLMDVLGSQEVTGKVTQADQALTKSTYPSLLGLQGAKDALAVEVSAASQILEDLAKESGRPYQILGGILDYLTLPSAK